MTKEVSKLNNSPRFPLWLKIVILVLVIGSLCVAGSVWVYYTYFQQFDVWGPDGPYTIDEILLTNELDSSERPIGSIDKFSPSERIICWVSTRGAEGIIGMRWYYGDELILEHFGKTQNNEIFTYIQSTPSATLLEGDYRVEIHTTGDAPRETLFFSVERYEPEVIPAQPTPVGHEDIENSAFVDVPFVFDEVWTINGTEWSINEVKVTLLDENVFVSVAVETDIELEKLSQEQAFALTKPIATYALQSGYLEQAENLQIDGQNYPLEVVYVNLINGDSTSRDIFGEMKKSVLRLGFNVKDLVEPQS